LHEFLSVVLRGLTDDADEIKVLCHMMLFRLSQVAPTTVSQRLDEASPELEETMKGPKVTKDTVKQDLERAMELQRSALRSIAALSKIANVGVSPRFCAFVESVEKGPFAAEYRDML
jgi:cullin-associated NEDD8-dissociated protein 1